ncbi:DUF1080 domain-containing protein, partial [bacterium]|nr:DUF1080 domain-containing protein [bacterium]
ARIVVHADRVTHRISRYMTGACIEDVNHEIYGGIYSQMIFGESFEEPAVSSPPEGFTAFGGTWVVKDGVLRAGAGQGAKLIPDGPEFSIGKVGVEMYFPDDKPGNAGLIVKLKDPGVGADRFIGYEVALSPRRKRLIFARHRNNFEPIREVRCDVPLEKWIPLVVEMGETSVDISVNGKTVLKYEDDTHPLRSGRVALRTWQRKAVYRDLWLKIEGEKKPLPFKSRADQSLTGEVSGMWRPLARNSAQGEFTLESEDSFNGSQSQRVAFLSGKGEIGIENQSLNRWGMYFQAGKSYEGYVWVRADEPADFYVAMESGDGSQVYSEKKLRASSQGWKRLDFALTPRDADKKGRFAIKLKNPASIVIGHAFLQPGSWGRFKGLPVRKDIAEGLLEQGLTVLRLGGSMINSGQYRWKKMIGPRDRRPPYRGTWYPYSTNGWGIIDFLNFCEQAGFLGIPAFNIEETPEDMRDFAEYVNGEPNSVWGSKRVEDGHPKPYNLKYIEIGNEEAINEHYFERFKLLAEAMWSKDPGIVPVVGDFLYNAPIRDPFDFRGAPRIKSLAVHKKILEFAEARGKAVWFDVHIWNHEPGNPDEMGGGVIGLRDFIRALHEFNTGADFKVCVFEENANNHGVRRALGHAHAINELERMGADVPVVCAANCLQPYKQNDNGWNQGMLFLTPSQAWGQPPYYVTQMISRNYLPLCVETDFESTGKALDVTAKKSEDGKALTVQVVNVSAGRVKSRMRLSGFTPRNPVARVIRIEGELDDVNTPDDPENIVSREREWSYRIEDGEMTYTFPPYSFTILRFE